MTLWQDDLCMQIPGSAISGSKGASGFDLVVTEADEVLVDAAERVSAMKPALLGLITGRARVAILTTTTSAVVMSTPKRSELAVSCTGYGSS